MADNVAVTPGSGETIATDDVGGVQYQRVKLDKGGDGATVPVVSGAGLPVIQEPSTSGGLTPHKKISTASTNATSLKASGGQVYAIYAHNTNASARYLKVYNKASSPTVGSDAPAMTFPIPGAAAGNGAILSTDLGIEFATGIAYALTTGVADADTGAVAADEIVLTILYK